MRAPWFTLAKFETRVLLRRWPMRLALLGFALWPLLSLRLSAERREFQAQALRESFGFIINYGLPLVAAALGAAALQSMMTRSLISTPISRIGLALSRFCSRGFLLLLALVICLLSFWGASALVDESALVRESPIENLRVADSSWVGRSPLSNRLWLAWHEGRAANLDLLMSAPPTGASIQIPYIASRDGGTVGETSRDWLEGKWRAPQQDWQPFARIHAAPSLATIELPERASGEIVVRLVSRRAATTLGIDVAAIRKHQAGGDLLGSSLALALRALLITFAMLGVGLAFSARFSQSTALVVSAGLFLLTIFGASIGFSSLSNRASLPAALGSPNQDAPTAPALIREVAAFLVPDSSPSEIQQRFEREAISIEPENSDVYSSVLNNAVFLSLAMLVALYLMRKREFIGAEEA